MFSCRSFEMALWVADLLAGILAPASALRGRGAMPASPSDECLGFWRHPHLCMEIIDILFSCISSPMSSLCGCAGACAGKGARISGWVMARLFF